MTAQDWENHILSTFPEAQAEENFGYRMFFVRDGRKVPFVSIAETDNQYDDVAGLNREGLFRVNIGIGRAAFKRIFPVERTEVDFGETNSFLPHPHYANQGYICILNPESENIFETEKLIALSWEQAA